MASSSQTSSSYSVSEPTFLETPENAIMNAISSVASGLAQQMLGWANQAYAQTSAITNQTVGNFFNVSQKMMGVSDTLTDQYNNIFAPQNASLAREADSYNSAARQRLNMGAAGATQAQAGENALRGAEESLRSYGIDPSSGRYAALDKAAAVQNAANIAGAQNQQRDRDIATGQRLRSEAVQVGAQLPAAIANVNNTAIQANTGASNASLANANTGRALMELPDKYLGTAMGIKMPISGQNARGGSQGSGFSSSPDRGGGGPGGGSGGGGGQVGGGGGGPAWMPQHGGAPGGGGGGGQGGGGGYSTIRPGTMAGIRNLQPYGENDWSDPTGQNYDPFGSYDTSVFDGGGSYYQPQEGYNLGIGEAGYSDQPFQDYGDPFQDAGFGQTYDYGGGNQTYTGGQGAQDTQWGNINYDTGANSVDPGWGQMYDQPVATDWGNGAAAYQSSPSYDTYSPSSDYYAGDYSGNYEDYGGVFAKGGPVPSGGNVPARMSPSGGRQVDDVPAQAPGGPARLNADEFVIPRDVALWKGQEFFQNLIDQSRKKRVTAPAKPQMQPMR